MRLSGAVLAAVVLGGCAVPARATEYLFDFHFDAYSGNGLSYAATDAVYRAGSPDALSLAYVSGSVNGYTPATIDGMLYSFHGENNVQFTAADSPLVGPALAIEGIQVDVNAVTAAGVYGPAIYGNGFERLLAVPAGSDGYFLGTLPGDGMLTVTAVPTPEPETWGMVGTGVLALLGVGRRRLGV